MTNRSLFDKIWDRHVVVAETESTPAVLYVDLHLVHEVTSPQAFDVLRQRNLKVCKPKRTLATLDHSTPTLPARSDGSLPYLDSQTEAQVDRLRMNCHEFGIKLHDFDSPNRGIVHVMGPELGATQPGMTIVCGDSHTATHGAFGSLAFGIGTTEVGHVLATQCLLQRKPKIFQVVVDGKLPVGVTAKDMILTIIGKIGVHGGTGYCIEYRGSAIRNLSMEERMTVCNMSIEAGARAGMIAADETTFAYLKDRPHSPQGADWEKFVEDWKTLQSDNGAVFDKTEKFSADEMSPMITWGTNPSMVMPANGIVPPHHNDAAAERALAYMGLQSGKAISDYTIDVVFIGSCTNSRISDLREAARLMDGQKVASNVRVLVVPGSEQVKKEAEDEGLNRIFLEAGAEWREPGCSMCLAMNGDMVPPGQYAVSTSNRNFEGRQGIGSRTFLASPKSAAAAAIRGRVVDPRVFESACKTENIA